MKKLRRIVWPLILGLSLVLVVGTIASRAAPEAALKSVNPGQHFLPPYENARDRFGFDCGTLSGYDVSLLNAGWYSNWGASLNPPHPDRLAHAQLIRFTAGADRHDPSQVTVSPNKATIAKIATAHPGSLWFMSNEPDSAYQGNPILPEVYAIVYHDFYAYIKGLDPTALIANGGIVQPTPCRLEYLDIVWDTYLETYGEPMPVDVWNIHAFVLREVYNSWGASTPPGVDPSCAMDYAVDEADDLDIFWDNIIAMRTWMQEKGYQDRPLVISEYGILWPQWWAPQFTPQRVSQFMTQTFDLFLHTTDPEIGYPADDYRLVQTWAWYSLSDDQQYNGALFNSGNKHISTIGLNYAAYTAALSDTLQPDLSAWLVGARPSFAPLPASAGLSTPLTFTVSLTGRIGNLGKLTATNALARFEIITQGHETVLLGHDAFYTVPARFDGAVVLPPFAAALAAPGRYALRLSLDPGDQIDELREWNNVATTTLELRPDLTPLALGYRLVNPTSQSRTLALTVTLGNQGSWSSSSVSATVGLATAPQGSLGFSQILSVPPLAVGEHVSLETSLPFSSSLLMLQVIVDPGHKLAELDETNNVVTTTLDVWPDLLPSALDYQLSLQPMTPGWIASLIFTSTVRNQGPQPSQAASATFYLETLPQETFIVSRSLPLSPLAADAQVSLTTGLTWTLLDHDLYRLRVVLDEEGKLYEQDTVNNQRVWPIPITVQASLAPTLTTVLTSFSGDVRIVFPGGAVTTPMDIIYAPWWPTELPATLNPAPVGFALTAVPGEETLLFSRPVSATWHYSDDDVVGLEIERLRLFTPGAGDAWPDAACQPYHRDPGQNQVTAAICQTGNFIFGNRYELYLPLSLNETLPPGRYEEVSPVPEFNLPPRLAPR
jgi:hypothetical protein